MAEFFTDGPEKWLLCRERDFVRPGNRDRLAADLRDAWDRGEFTALGRGSGDDAFERFLDALMGGALSLIKVDEAPRILDSPRSVDPTPPPDPRSVTPDAGWVEFEVVGVGGERFAGRPFSIEYPDGTSQWESLSDASDWRSEAPSSRGTCTVRFEDPLAVVLSAGPTLPTQMDDVVIPTGARLARVRTGRRTRLVVHPPVLKFVLSILGPDGKRIPLPVPSLAVQVVHDDGALEDLTPVESGFLLPVRRPPTAVGLRYRCDGPCLVVPETGEPYFASHQQAKSATESGARFLEVPVELTTAEYLCVADGLSVDARGRVLGLTEDRGQHRAVNIAFAPLWHHLQFEYYDRVARRQRSVGGLRGASALVLEGFDTAVLNAVATARTFHRVSTPVARAAWPVVRAAGTVHCLAHFVPRHEHAPDIQAVFQLPEGTFIDLRESPPAVVHSSDPDVVEKPGVVRWHLYDLPSTWGSQEYPSSRGRWDPSRARVEPFLPRDTQLDTPAVYSLDIVLLCDSTRIAVFRDGAGAFSLERPVAAYFDADGVEPYRAASRGPLRTDVESLRPVPDSALLLDVPADARLFLVGARAFAAFGQRTLPPETSHLTWGARIAVELDDKNKDRFASKLSRSDAPRVSNVDLVVLRCCGVVDGRELVRVFAWGRFRFNYDPSNVEPKTPLDGAASVTPLPVPPALEDQERWERDCLTAAAQRWTKGWSGPVLVGSPPSTEIRGVALFQSSPGFVGDMGPEPKYEDGEIPPDDAPTDLETSNGTRAAHYRVRVYQDCRAHMSWPLAQWELSEIRGPSDTPAHELGHALGLADEYIESAGDCSGGLHGFSDRIPGSPYASDGTSLMNGGHQPRLRHAWLLGQAFRRVEPSVAQQPVTIQAPPFHIAFGADSPNAAGSRHRAAYLPQAEHHGVVGDACCAVYRFDLAHEPPAVGSRGLVTPADAVLDGLVVIKVNIAWDFEDTAMSLTSQSLNWANWGLGRLTQRLCSFVVGTHEGRLRTLRLAVSARHLLVNCPTATDGKWATMRTKYLVGCRAETQGEYDAKVSRIIERNPAHVVVGVRPGPRRLYVGAPGAHIDAVATSRTPSGFETLAPRILRAALGMRPTGPSQRKRLEPLIRTVFDAPDLVITRVGARG